MQNLIEAIFKIHKSGLLGRSVKIFKKKKQTKFQLKNTSFVSKKKRTIYNAVLLHAYTSWKSSKIPYEKPYKLQIIVLVQQKIDAVSWFFLQEVQVV